MIYLPIRHLLRAPLSDTISGVRKAAKNKIVKIPALMETDIKQNKCLKIKMCQKVLKINSRKREGGGTAVLHKVAKKVLLGMRYESKSVGNEGARLGFGKKNS